MPYGLCPINARAWGSRAGSQGRKRQTVCRLGHSFRATLWRNLTSVSDAKQPGEFVNRRTPIRNCTPDVTNLFLNSPYFRVSRESCSARTLACGAPPRSPLLKTLMRKIQVAKKLPFGKNRCGIQQILHASHFEAAWLQTQRLFHLAEMT